MKKIIFALIALLTIASCTKESIESLPSSSEVQFTTSSEVTRANEKSSWSNGDPIGIYAGTVYKNVQYNAVVEGSAVSFSPENDAIYDTSHTAEMDFYAYYPFDQDDDTGDTTVSFDIADQVDMLQSSATSKDASVEFQFKHVHSIIDLTVSKGSDLASLSGLKISIESNTLGTMSITDGETTAASESAYNSMGMDVEVAAEGNSATASAIVMAHNYSETKVIITFEIAGRTFTQSFNPEWSVSGKRYKYTVEVGLNELTFTAGDITEWGTEVSDSTLVSGSDIVITADYEFQIYTAKGLAAFRDLVNGLTANNDANIKNLSDYTYTFGSNNSSISGKLMNDIYIGDICNETNNVSWIPIGSNEYNYGSTFNGNGYEVQGLYISVNSSTRYTGLFGDINGNSSIKNLGVRGSVSGGCYIGGLVGYQRAGGNIDLCYSAVTVTSTDTSTKNIGGLVGCSDGTITNSYNMGSVSGVSNEIGGVVGCSNTQRVANCYNMGSVSSTGSQIGGVAGSSNYGLSNCYSVALVSGSEKVGGVVGSLTGSYTKNGYYLYHNSKYYSGDVAGYISNSIIPYSIEALTTEYMKSEEFLDKLNAAAKVLLCNAWIQGSDGYPIITDVEAMASQ